jgi:hypothetical protein
MSLEVVAQLPGSDEHYIKQLVDLQIPCLGFVEDFADVVHRALDGPDPSGGGGGSARLVPSARALGVPDPLDLEGPPRFRPP